MAWLPEYERALLGDASSVFDAALEVLAGVPEAKRYEVARRAAYCAAKLPSPGPREFTSAEVVNVSTREIPGGGLRMSFGIRVKGRPVVRIDRDAPQGIEDFAVFLDQVASWLRSMGKA